MSDTKLRRRVRQRPRNNNSKFRQNEAFRARIGKKVAADYIEQRRQKFQGLDPINPKLVACIPLAFLKMNHPKYTYLPFSTIGIGRIVQDLYQLNKNAFIKSKCTQQHLFIWCLNLLQQRRCLVNDELTAPFKPQSFAIPALDKFLSPSNVILKPLARLINSYCVHNLHGKEYMSVIPPGTDRNPYYVTLECLESLIETLAKEDNELHPQFNSVNALPGAEFQEGRLINKETFQLELDTCQQYVESLFNELTEQHVLVKISSNIHMPVFPILVFPVGETTVSLVATSWIPGVTFGHQIGCSKVCLCMNDLRLIAIDFEISNVDGGLGIELCSDVVLWTIPLERFRWKYRLAI